MAHQLQQKPDLLLTFVKTARIPADKTVWHLIAQPVTGAGHNAHMLTLQPDFFVQLPNHGLLGRLATINAALRKLPGVRTDTLAPKHLIFLVEQDDADVRPEAVSIQHNQTPNF